MNKKGPRFSTYVFAFMAILMLVSSILPSFQNNQPQNEPVPTPTTAAPTFPAPIENVETISLDQTILAPSAMFSIAQPTGWTASPANTLGSEIGVPDAAGISMDNATALSQIQAYVEAPVTPIENLQQLSDRMNQTVLETSWRRFGGAQEIGRRIDDEKQQVIVDFELSQGQQTFVARQVSWIGENGWINTVRVAAPDNAQNMLFYLIENLPATLKPVDAFTGQPMAYTAYYDNAAQHIVRYPRNWQVLDAGAGNPVTIQGPNGEFLNVRFEAGQNIADDAAATRYVEGLRPGTTVKSVNPVERNGVSGFSVAYGLTTVDGEPISGLAVMLNGEDGLHVTTVRVPNVDTDYNAAPEGEAVQILNTFTLTSGLNLPVPAAAPTPFVTPTPEATVEATAEATTEATSEATTESATAEATPEATPES